MATVEQMKKALQAIGRAVDDDPTPEAYQPAGEVTGLDGQVSQSEASPSRTPQPSIVEQPAGAVQQSLEASPSPEQPLQGAPETAPTLSQNDHVTAALTQLVHGPKSRAQFDDAQVALDAARIGNVGDTGEILSQGHDRQAQLLGEQLGRQDVYLKGAEDAKKRHDADQERYLTDQHKFYQDYIKKLDERPKESTFLKVMSLVAMFGAMGNGSLSQNGRGASLVTALNGMMNQDAQRLAQAQDAMGAKLTAAGFMHDKSASAEHNEIAAAQGMVNLLGARYETALKQVAASTESENVKSLARQAQGQLAQQRLDASRQLWEKRRAAGVAAGKVDFNRVRADAVDELGRQRKLPWKEQQQWDANQKLQGDTKTGDEGIGQEVLPGYLATIKLEKKDVSDIRANRNATTKVNEKIKDLWKIYGRNRGKMVMDQNDKKVASATMAAISGLLSQMNGMGAPSEAERKAMFESIPNPNEWHVLSDPAKIYEQLIQNNEASFQAGLEALGVNKVGVQKPTESSDAPKADSPFRSFGRY